MKGDGSPLYLGIDTGGTFTDSVIFDPASQKIIAASKAPTTHGRLIEGIGRSVAGLSIRDPLAIGLVGLSTTLATNAVVEGKNRPVGLLIVGYDHDLTVPIPGVVTRRVSGGHTVRGEQAAPLDETAVKAFIAAVDHSVEAYACASYFSVRNPRHEDRVEAIIKKIAQKPVVLGHHLSMDLDAEVRATTAALNAGLIPLIAGLLEAVKTTLCRLSIDAPLMVVRGDGSLMSETTARMRPIETILSGPAASVVGARVLARSPGNHDTTVIDVGGTTTDIAALSGGEPRLCSRGARVGKYRTFVSAVDMRTTGLGGDSLIGYADGRAPTVGPLRVLPIGRLAERYPGVSKRLDRFRDAMPGTRDASPTDFFAVWSGPDMDLSAEEREFLERIEQSPLCDAEVTDVRERLRMERIIDRLTASGTIVRAGLTPTDVFNARGLSCVGDPEASKRALAAAAARAGTTPDEFARRVWAVIEERLFFLIAASSLDAEGLGDPPDFGILASPVADWLSGRADRAGMRITIGLDNTIIGVGAPVDLFVKPIAERLGAPSLVPPDAAVASAVGAVSGVLTAQRTAVIRAFDDGGFVLFTPGGRRDFRKLADAKASAMEELSILVREEIETAPTVEPGLTGQWEEHWGGQDENKILIEAKLTVRAVARHAAGT